MSSHPYLPQRPLFKAYDIRGDRALFSDDFVQDLSREFAHHLTCKAATCVVVGHDVRQGSDAIAYHFAQSFSQAGIKVIWLGLITTPIMAFWAQQFEGHGIIATASHSEGHINGIKWLISGESPSSEDIEQLYEALGSNHPASDPLHFNTPTYSPAPQADLTTDLCTAHIATAYFDHITAALSHIHHDSLVPSASSPELNCSLPTSQPLTVVIDCLNGATGPFAHDLFSRLSHLTSQVIVINDRPDGDFPKGNPDPTESGRLKELQQFVVAHQADIGFGFDGDGDRLMVVDNNGNLITSDHLIYLLAQVALQDSRNCNSATDGQPKDLREDESAPAAISPTVIFDVKCSHHLPTLIQNLGATPQMSKTGSSIMRKALQSGSSSAIFAGELSGHFLFNDGLFILHDDAMYAAVRLLNWLSHKATPLSAIVADLPNMVNTPDVYLPLKRFEYIGKHSLLQKLNTLCQSLQHCCPSRLQQALTKCGHTAPLTHAERLGLPSNTRLTCIDGIRLDFANGFGVIRPSNTSHSITVRFAGNTLDDLKNIQRRFVALCKNIDEELADQIANIRPSG